jgi:hypothetical protein
MQGIFRFSQGSLRPLPTAPAQRVPTVCSCCEATRQSRPLTPRAKTKVHRGMTGSEDTVTYQPRVQPTTALCQVPWERVRGR